ncbi:MAG: hypothetical protein P1V36_06170 [Planctomycetota bacterium]|nr:hypothetical protein [Planctomycetota bacterium]
MGTEICMAIYRPKPGKDAELAALIEGHVPVLRGEGLATDREAIVMRSRDGSFVEIFEWAEADAAGRAHENAAVAAIWGAMMEVATFGVPADLAEATTRFAHFAPV